MAFGVAVGVAGGVLVNVPIGVLVGVAAGGMGGMFGGLAGGTGPEGVALAITVGMVPGMLTGMTQGVLVGLERVEKAVAHGVAVGVAYGVGGGVFVGLAVDVAFGVVFGVAFGVALILSYYRIPTYFINILLSLDTYLTARRNPERISKLWRRCPVYWNEMIWLPLPFVGKTLALLVKQDREEGFRQIAFVAAERKLQRRVARQALIEVASDDLEPKNLEGISKAAEKLSWTTDAPMELPEEFSKALPRFEKASNFVGQYLTLNSSYRKGEAIEKGLSEVEQLQRGLISARGKWAPRLLQIANEWGALMKAELESLKAQGELKKSIPNPFVFGTPVAETERNVFTGRQDVVRQIEESVLNSVHAPTLLLQGPRRMGKSSILNQLRRLLGPDFAPACVDLQQASATESLPSLLGTLSRAIAVALQQRRVSVRPPSRSDFAEGPFSVFEEWLDKIEREIPENMRILLALDEYEMLDRAFQEGWGAGLLDTLRHWFQHRPKLVLMFTGVRTIEELGPAWTDRFISVRRVRVSFLSHEDVIPLLTEPIPEFDMTYGDGALDLIFTETAGQPFLTQAVAFELVQYLNKGERKKAGNEDVEVAIERALASGGAYFANVWNDAKEEGQAILTAIATGKTLPEQPKALKWLQENDVLAGDMTFHVRMMERWVRDNID